jgi:hypothetical protein
MRIRIWTREKHICAYAYGLNKVVCVCMYVCMFVSVNNLYKYIHTVSIDALVNGSGPEDIIHICTHTYIHTYIHTYRELSIDALVNGSGPEDIILGPGVLTKLKTLGFEHMLPEFYYT